MKKLAIAMLAAALLPFSAGTLVAQPTALKPVQLKPLPTTPINLHTNEDSKAVYQALGKLLGLTISFDPDYHSTTVQVDIANASPAEAFHTIGDLTGTYYLPVTPDTILVIQNTHQKHNDLDDQFDQIFYLRNSTQQADANEVIAAMRNMLPPEARIFLIASENAIEVHTTPENIARAQKILDDLDKPKKTYRLTFTVSEVDGGKQVGTQHFTLVAVSGQQTKLKQGSKVPIAMGSYNPTATTGDHPAPAGVQTQYTYLDVGMNFDATVTALGDRAILKSDVVQSSIAPEVSGLGAQDPIVRQTELIGEATLSPGKPQVLGSIDIPGSTRHLDIEVLLENLP